MADTSPHALKPEDCTGNTTAFCWYCQATHFRGCRQSSTSSQFKVVEELHFHRRPAERPQHDG